MKTKHFLLILLFIFSLSLWTTNKDNEKRKLEIDAEIHKIAKQKSTVLNEIYKLELIYEKELIKSKSLDRELNDINSEIKELVSKKTVLVKQLSITRDGLIKAIRILYKTKEQPPFLFIIRINTLNNLFKHYHYFNNLFNYKTNQLSIMKTKVSELIKIEEKLSEKKSLTTSLQTEIGIALKQIQTSKDTRIKYLEKVNKDYQYFKQLYEELETQDSEISKVISDQPHYKKIESINSEKLKGHLPWPLKGKVLNNFGKVKSTQFNTFVFNNGIRIRPDQSENIYSVYPGVVLLATYFKGYGKLLIIRHSKDLYTLYGHCNTINKSIGEWVQQNEIIATVGDTGSTLGKVLYFEIRKGIKSENPLLWLSKRKR